jgi:parallel beta-helix repeat protein
VIGHNSRVRLNAAHGNGYSDPSDDFGIGIQGGASGNVIEENTAIGNPNGIYIAAAAGAENVVRENVVVGNPAIQSAATRPTVEAVNILNLAPAGRITFERNVCVTSVNAPCPTPYRQQQ